MRSVGAITTARAARPRGPTPNPAPVGDITSGLAIGLALGVSLGILTGNLPTGIGTGVAVGIASDMARKKGSNRWMMWLSAYAAVVLVAFAFRLAGILTGS